MTAFLENAIRVIDPDQISREYALLDIQLAILYLALAWSYGKLADTYVTYLKSNLLMGKHF